MVLHSPDVNLLEPHTDFIAASSKVAATCFATFLEAATWDKKDLKGAICIDTFQIISYLIFDKHYLLTTIKCKSKNRVKVSLDLFDLTAGLLRKLPSITIHVQKANC